MDPVSAARKGYPVFPTRRGRTTASALAPGDQREAQGRAIRLAPEGGVGVGDIVVVLGEVLQPQAMAQTALENLPEGMGKPVGTSRDGWLP